jgi:hypothetical protein
VCVRERERRERERESLRDAARERVIPEPSALSSSICARCQPPL